MTLGDNETDPTKKRTIRWKERFSRRARQHEEQGLGQQHLSPPSDTTSKHTSTSISSQIDNSDNISNHSGSSMEIPCESNLNDLPVTKAQLTRNKDLHENFKQVPLDDTLLHEFKCALQKDVLLQGRLYLTKNYVCFKSNILGYITTVELKIQDIKYLDRVRTLRFMPRVIQLTMKNDDKYTFTSFLSSLSARDEAYDSLTELWHQGHPPTAPSSVVSSASSVSSSATTIPSALSPSTTSPEKLPPALILPDNNTEHKGSDVIDTINSNAYVGTPSTATPNSGHFKIFHRRRAQTVSVQNGPSARERSDTSSSTPLVKNSSNHITWMDDRQENATAGAAESTASSSRSSSKSSILRKQRKALFSSSSNPPPTAQDQDTNDNRSLTRTNVTTIFAVGGFVLLLSHLILTYEFYHVTQQFTIQQQQQQQQDLYFSRSSPQQKQQLQNKAWISEQLQDVKNQAQMWEQETLRQRKKLLDLIPS